MSRVLVIDDEAGIRQILSEIITDEGHTAFTAADGIEGLSLLNQEPIDVVLLDVWLPNMGGIDVLKKIKEDYPRIEVIIISGHANIDMAVSAVKLGAFDFLEKPLSLERVVTLIRNAQEFIDLKKGNTQLRLTLDGRDEMIGESEPMQQVRELIEQSASSDTRILIQGENGTGKELVARQIHNRSSRREGPFVEVNCAAIPDTLLESELFGHEKGAFTSAVSRRKGKFELADEGTLFLDEIADMSPDAQAKVLRAIQELRFERIGGEESIHVDVRIIAATNRDLQQSVRDGAFREDLYFRLNVIPIFVPPLRDRLEDLSPLLDYFFELYADSNNTEIRRLSEEAMEYLKSYSWPGNIRELKNFCERLTVMTDETEISRETVSFYLGQSGMIPENDPLEDFSDMSLNQAKEAFERKILVQKLKENGYNISKTAQHLGIYPSNLHGKIKKYGIEIER
ncbi:MAG: sigma-54 dependent transcriptional regulator [Spirochaetales bacterium]|nr:sigma-54 dependent transcriptional regulator [Spirochaetales bacterium]MCF7938259.1 sigma-54 dependent transcriptional regulator [Spirochaetales bacterium]